MRVKPVVFRAGGEVHRADTCRPLVEAARAGRVRLEALARGAYPGRPLPDGALPGLRSIGFWDAHARQDWGLGLHRNEGVELTFLESGEMPLLVEGRRAVMKPDQLLITRPWQPHQLGDPHIGRGRLVWLILDVGVRHPHQRWTWPPWLVLTQRDREDLTRYLRGNEQLLWTAPAEIRHCFQRICQTLCDRKTGDGISRLAVVLNVLFLDLLEMFRGQRVPVQASLSSARRSVEIFLAELPQHLAEPWTLETMASRCAVGATAFSQHCRKLTALAPMQYVNHLRVQAAGSALRADGNRNVTQIALDCGFSSGQYFANVFRRQMKCTPRQYRAAHESRAS
jgi:AraC-like DNA-binding protein